MKMISFTYLFAVCLAYAGAIEQLQENSTNEDVARRELTDAGYVIRYGDEVYRYPVIIEPNVRPSQRNQDVEIRTNEIQNEEEDKRQPLFYFTSYEIAESRPEGLPTSRPYIEIRKKRDLENSEIPESSKVGKLRRKRTYCRKCGGGRGGGYYAVPVSYAVYPVYYGGGQGGYGGGGKGCYSCGGGYGGGGGGGGSFSYSSSSAQSSSGSFGWGKK